MAAANPPPAPTARRQLTAATLHPRFENAVTAVRGKHTIKANKYDKWLKAGDPRGEKLPFDNVVFCNIGNPHSLGQKPLTFVRQVLALVDYPALLDAPATRGAFPADAIARAETLRAELKGASSGSYSNSQGVPYVREAVARFITARDGGLPASADDVFLTDGASKAINMVLQLLVRDANDAILVPVPQYPIYSGTLGLLGGTIVGYSLTEGGDEPGWSVDVGDLARALTEARASGLNVRAVVVINPGNPIGNVLSAAQVRGVAKFAADEGLALLADEVYQDNVYVRGKEFLSFKRAAADVGVTGALELFSFHSVSKGFFGECGRRGGYVECQNICAEAKMALYRMMALGLCANVPGQLVLEMLVNPPAEGDASFPSWREERDGLLASLRRRATLFCDAFNALPGISCEPAEGALYIFPRIAMPAAAVAAAAAEGVAPDALYADALLEATGVVVVPGSGFKQAPGTHHIRFAFLPPEDALGPVVGLVKKFHLGFLEQYKDSD